MAKRFSAAAWVPNAQRSRFTNPKTGEDISRRQFLNQQRGVTVEQFRSDRAVKAMKADSPERLKRAVIDFRRKRPRFKSEREVLKNPRFGQVLNDMMSGDEKRVIRAMEALKRPEKVAEYYL